MRSRTGCWTCRDDGYKCDEKRPSCGRCVRLKKACKGYGVRLRWKKTQSFKTSPPSSQQLSHMPRPGLQVRPHMARISDCRFGDEPLLNHWQTTLADIVSVSAGPCNPFLVHLTPLVAQSDALRSVVASMAANHLALLQPDRKWDVISIQHRLNAVASLRKNIATAHPETSLAAVTLLGMSERLFATDSKVNHLEGAKALIRHCGGQSAWSSSTGRFLLGLCWYHDVLASVSKSQAPLLGLENVLVEGLSSFAKLSIILSLVGQISGLRSARAGDRGSNDVEEQVILGTLISLKEAGPLDDDSRNTEIHRQAALIYFHRTTNPSETSDSYLILCSRLCLDHLAKIPCSSPLISSHIWPLWTAGCEAVDPKLREFVLRRLDEMFQARRLAYMQRLRQDIVEVWYMKDLRRNQSGMDDIDCVNAIRSTHNREADII